MPLYNEGAHIYENLRRVREVLTPLETYEIIAANDGSLDNSRAELDRAAMDFPEVHPLHLPRGGKGEALRKGTEAAQGEWVIFIDSDLDLPPEQILFFLAEQKAHKADAVIGSKMHPDSTVDYPLRRRIYSTGYYWLVKFLFGLPVRDTQTGLKLVRRDLLLRALERTKLKGFAFDLELLVHLVELKAKVVEAPVVVDFKMKFGGIGWTAVLQIARDTARTWWSVRNALKRSQ